MHVFGYGSLTFSPALPDALIGVRLGRVPGLARAFNKRSRSRSAPADACFDAPDPPRGWTLGGRRVSITLGTTEGDGLHGFVATYRAGVEAALIPLLDAREGWAHDDPDSGYLPRDVEVDVDGSIVVARAYLTNPDASWTLRPPPSPEEIARILIHSTPRVAVGGPRAPGLEYLEGTRGSLRDAGVLDPHLEAVARAVRAVPGPWTQRVAPVR